MATNSWEQRKYSEVFISLADKGHPDLPVLAASQQLGMIRRDENGIVFIHEKKNENGYKRVVPGNFVIHLRSFQGGFAHSDIEGITSPAYTVLAFSDSRKHAPHFWKYVFTSERFIKFLEKVTYGIRDGRTISVNDFYHSIATYPSVNEQTKIARALDQCDSLITLHQREGKYSSKQGEKNEKKKKCSFCRLL